MTQQQIIVPEKVICSHENGTKDVYICHEKLGQGGFSVVHHVTHQNTKKSYAMKVIAKERYLNSSNKILLQKLENEIKIQKNLNHPNIVLSKDSFTDEHNQYMILEYCPGKTIYDYLKKSEKGYLTELETRKILKDILHGLLYLHNNKIIHHDLKLENFIIGSDGRVKIADFGVSSVLKNFNEKCYSICGTTNYMSPELLQKENKGHGFEVDIWAIGISAFILLTGQYPFGGFENDFIYEKIKNCDYRFPSNIQLSNEAKNFIKTIFRIDPRKRPRAIELLEHPFMTKFDKEKVQLYRSPSQLSNKPSQNKFNLNSSPLKFSPLNNRYNCYYLGNTINCNNNNNNNNKPIVKPIVSNDLSQSLKNFNYDNSQYINENSQSNNLNLDYKKNFIIPNHFVTKYSFYYQDLGFLLGDGTVGVCFNDRSRIVMDPNEEFVQYYKNYNSGVEVIKLDETFNDYQKNKLYNKISLVQKFAQDFKKFGFSYNLTDLNYDHRVPLYHVKYFVMKNDSILFKLNDNNIQMNFSDHKKLIIFWNSKQMCLVKYLKERCCLLDIKDVKMNQNCEEYKRLKNSKELISSISQKNIKI